MFQERVSSVAARVQLEAALDFVRESDAERDMMLERQRDGIAKAKSEGKYKGRAPAARAERDDVRRLASEGIGAAEIGRRFGIHRASVYRVLAP